MNSRRWARVSATSAVSLSTGNLGRPGVLGDAAHGPNALGGQRHLRKKSTPKKPPTPAQHLPNVHSTSTLYGEKCLTRPSSPRHGVVVVTTILALLHAFRPALSPPAKKGPGKRVHSYFLKSGMSPFLRWTSPFAFRRRRRRRFVATEEIISSRANPDGSGTARHRHLVKYGSGNIVAGCVREP